MTLVSRVNSLYDRAFPVQDAIGETCFLTRLLAHAGTGVTTEASFAARQVSDTTAGILPGARCGTTAQGTELLADSFFSVGISLLPGRFVISRRLLEFALEFACLLLCRYRRSHRLVVLPLQL